jgi:hypothetical protein
MEREREWVSRNRESREVNSKAKDRERERVREREENKEL